MRITYTFALTMKNVGTPPKKVKASPESIKAALRAAGATYDDVARLADVSWFMVWAVVNHRKTSGPVMRAISKVTGGAVDAGGAAA